MFINSRKENNSIPTLINFDSITIDNGQDIDNIFAQFYTRSLSTPAQSSNWIL